MAELSYAGHGLLYDQGGRVQAFLDRYQPLRDLLAEIERAPHMGRTENSITGDRHNLSLGVPNYPPRPSLTINQLYWPTGASRWAIGFFLCTDQVKRQLFNTGSSQALNSPAAFVFDDGLQPRFEAELYLLAPRPVTVEIEGAAGQRLWLLPLVDERYWWQYKHIEAVELDDESTWELDGDLGLIDALGVEIDEIAAADSDYGIPDEELSRAYENAALTLDALAWSTGRRFVRWPDGTCKLLTAGASESQHQLNLDAEPWFMIAGGALDAWQVPEAVRVCFPRLADHIPCPHKIYVVDKAAPSDAMTVPNTFYVVHAAAWARRTDSDLSTVPDNSSWLNALAEQIRDDYYDWLGLAYDYTYQGCKAWKPSGHDDHVLYTFGEEYGDGFTAGGTLHSDGATVPVVVRHRHARSVTTRIVSLPANAAPVQNLAQDDENVVLRGVQMAVSQATITRAAPAACRVIVHDTTIANEYKFLRDVNNEYVEITVGAYSANSSESIEAETALYVNAWPSGRWEPIGGNCEVRDWQTPDEETAESLDWQSLMDGAAAAMENQRQGRPQQPPVDGGEVHP